MPKIEVSAKALYKYMGKKVTGQEFIDLIQCAKAELDEEDGDTLKIELNDTNRPDLWSTAGFGRLLKLYLGIRSSPARVTSRTTGAEKFTWTHPSKITALTKYASW